MATNSRTSNNTSSKALALAEKELSKAQAQLERKRESLELYKEKLEDAATVAKQSSIKERIKEIRNVIKELRELVSEKRQAVKDAKTTKQPVVETPKQPKVEPKAPITDTKQVDVKAVAEKLISKYKLTVAKANSKEGIPHGAFMTEKGTLVVIDYANSKLIKIAKQASASDNRRRTEPEAEAVETTRNKRGATGIIKRPSAN